MYEPRRSPLVTFAIGGIVLAVAAALLFFVWQTFFTTSPAPRERVSTATPATIATETTVLPTPSPTSLPEPTLTPASTSTPTIEPDVRFGVVAREDGCVAFSEVAQNALAELDLVVELVDFNDSDALFAALADRDVDLTLCFQDPADRSYLTEYVGFMRTIDAPYFDGENSRLQVMLNAANVVPFREEKPCMLNFLRELTFDAPIEAVDDWLVENESTVAAWTECE